MHDDLIQWAVAERQFIKEDIKWLKAGAKLISPSGDDISTTKIEQLEARLEHLQKALADKGGN